MPEERNREEIAFIARWAGISVPRDRLPGLDAGLTGTRTQAEAIGRYELGVTEPASRFTPPASR
jgi:hypothetical protein